MNTLFILIAKNSKLELKTLGTKANLTLNVEGMGKLIFTNVHFVMSVGLETDNEYDRKKAKPFTIWLKRFVLFGNLGAKACR
jgi:hypothetical protein